MNIFKHLIPKNKQKIKPPIEHNLGFGNLYSDHMFTMNFLRDTGWVNPSIVPFAPLSLSPAAMVLHYSQTIFEGLKCYRQKNGSLALFRPKDNFKRLNRSADCLCIPRIDENQALKALKELLRVDQDWVPHAEGSSLYIRPTIIATEAHIGVRPANEYLFFIITGPVGAYYAAGFNPVKIYVETQHSRAAEGGLGSVKAGANYAASLYASEKAMSRGYAQTLWLDSKEHRYVEEVGSMNIFFLINDELITSPLSGTVLPGITRDSVISLANDWGYKVSQRPILIDEIVEAAQNNTLKEVFGSGTAAVISPVSALSWNDSEYIFNQGKIGSLTQRLFDELTGIQYGLKTDSKGWMEYLSI